MDGDGAKPPTLSASTPAAYDEEPVLVRGAVVGRYLIIDRLGGGAAGIVYSAYDPWLDRRVAIKVLRRREPLARERFLYEMRALARMTHPNVIAIFDASESDGRPFLAMELCSSGTLADWCRAEPRSLEEKLDVFIEAGEGLTAAHEAGFVHRDFKPTNVLMGKDGRPRVGDFGLVRRLEAARIEVEESTAVPRLGTLRYMADEQLAGKLATPESDQFAFCVSLYDSLFDQRPFPGDDVPALRQAIARGPIVPSLRTRSARRVWPVLQRGLGATPSDRFGSMAELLTALRRARSRTAMRLGTLVIVAGVVATAATLTLRTAAVPACGEARTRLAGVWDDDRRAAVAAAFRRSGRPHWENSLAVVTRALDAYAADWAVLRDQACQATRVTHEQSPQLLDLRVSCLEERREELRAYAGLLALADGPLVDKAGPGASKLTGLGRCADGAALLSVAPPPADPTIRARIERVRAAMARASALKLAGKLGEARVELTSCEAEARGIGYAPLQADALLHLEQVDLRPADLKVAERQLRDAIFYAEAGHDEEIQVSAWSALAAVYAYADDPDRLTDALRHGQALLDGLGRPLRLEAPVASRLGAAANIAGRFAEAVPLLQRALAATERLYAPDDPERGVPHTLIGNAYQGLGNHAESLAHGLSALTLYEKSFGELHPRTCLILGNLSGEYLGVERLDEALATGRRAVDSCARAVGYSTVYTANALMNEGNALISLDRLDEALPPLQSALAITNVIAGPESSQAAILLANLAELTARRGHVAAGLGLIERAQAIITRAAGERSAYARPMVGTQAEILLLAQRPREALAAARRYRDLSLALPEADAQSRVLVGRALIASHELREARELLEPVVGADSGRPVDLLAARYLLARALAPIDRARATALDKAAREELAHLGPTGRHVLSDLERQLP